MIDGDVGELTIEVALELDDQYCLCVGCEPTYYFGVDPGGTGE